MIELRVADYCHQCSKFNPEATIFYADNEVEQTIVKCSEECYCEAKMNFLYDWYQRNKGLKSHE